MTVTISDVEQISSTNWEHLDQTTKQALLDDAEGAKDDIYSARVSHIPTLAGDADRFVKYLAAHKWTLAEGGETQSMSQTGGNVNYNLASADAVDNLSHTRYGREAKKMLRDEQSIGIVRTDR